jgi:hypothetical protein
MRDSLLRLLKGFQHLFRPCTYGDVFGEIHPADRPGGINQKFCRARNVSAFGPGAGMQEIVTSDHIRARIRQECIGITKFLALASVDLGSVNANRGDTNPARFKFRKPLLETPQLGVA